MKIVLSGGTGFLGSKLSSALVADGHEIISLTRRNDFTGLVTDRKLRYVPWDGKESGQISRYVEGCEAIVNLAGESIGTERWTDERKHVLAASRILPTNTLVEAIAEAGAKPKVLVNQSAVGYYGNVDDGDVLEEFPPGRDFLAQLCVKWEATARKAEEEGVRVVILRTGVVLGGKGSALEKMIMPFRYNFGGPIGSGMQWFPWVHLDDFVGVVRYALTNEKLKGPINVTAPEPVRMKEFSAAVGAALGKRSWAAVPPWVLRTMLGEMAEMILGGQRAIPVTLAASGYRFVQPSLQKALGNLLGSPLQHA